MVGPAGIQNHQIKIKYFIRLMDFCPTKLLVLMNYYRNLLKMEVSYKTENTLINSEDMETRNNTE